MPASTGHEHTTWELAGDTAWTPAEYADEVTRQSGTPITYRRLPAAEYGRALLAGGLPEFMVPVFEDTEAAIGRGELGTTTGHLSRLLGRPTTPLAETIAVTLTR
ncbi:hypothetical protein [Embleya scabrispora]|uniref:hypothetical protein n=1 Tax=Embleya scabrispora TaxID=159449 RepID=UPI0003677684|nr:hypothetical protein [Embleya scabrispora]MYS78736.1 hypothetical protein [Streptomyces sp. SID5474]